MLFFNANTFILYLYLYLMGFLVLLLYLFHICFYQDDAFALELYRIREDIQQNLLETPFVKPELLILPDLTNNCKILLIKWHIQYVDSLLYSSFKTQSLNMWYKATLFNQPLIDEVVCMHQN